MPNPSNTKLIRLEIAKTGTFGAQGSIITAEDLKELPIELQGGNSSNDDKIYAIAIRHKKAGEKVCIVTSDGGFDAICNKFPDLQAMGKGIPCLRPDNIVEMK